MSMTTQSNTLLFDDFVGNKGALGKLKLLTHEAYGNSYVRIPDMAFLGPPGHGKNYCARILAGQLGRTFIEINATVVRDPFQFRSFIVSGDFNGTGAIIHLDECHQLPRRIQDNLLSALEHPRVLHTGTKDQVLQDSLPENISFIFSTTHAGALRKALMSRLEQIEFLEYSTDDYLEMAAKYLKRQWKLTSSNVEPAGIVEIANRARSGRQVVKFCDAIVRQMKREGVDKITAELVTQSFDILGVDKFGLTRTERKMLRYMASYNSFIGLDTLEAVLDITKREIKDVMEPYLLKKGFIARRAAGRIITEKGKKTLV